MRPPGAHLADLFEAAALRHGDRTCLTWGERSRASYREVAAALEAQAAALAAGGYGGARIGICCRNRPELVVLWLACMRAGTTPVFLNPEYTLAEVSRVVADLDVALLVGEGEFEGAGTALAPLPETEATAPVELPPAGADAGRFEERASVVLTSGSTGRPKYVPVPHAAYTLKAALNAVALGWVPDDAAHCAMPLFHVGAQCETLVPALATGASVHLLRAFSASELWGELEERRITHFHATGSLIAMALARGEPREGALRRIVGSLRGDLAEALGAALPDADLISVYGLTECPLGTVSAPGEPYRPGWVGHPYVPAGLRLVEGEIQLRNAACTDGCIGLPAGEGFSDDGWLRTGDLGALEDGGLYLTGRIKEMIRRSGENIAPAEVEEAALAHPAIVEAAAVPFADSIRDEEVRLFVEPAAGHSAPAPEQLREFMSARLALFKLPRYVDALPSLPKTPSNKVDKPRLQAEHEAPAWDAEAAGERL